MKLIKYYRRELNLNQWELAEVSGVSRAKIQQIEQGIRQPNEEEVRAICRALGISDFKTQEAENG